MIRLNSDYVHYLNLSNLQEFSNLTLISLPDGELFRMNPMTLAAFGTKGSRLVKTISDRQDLEDELILITEFNKFELQMVMNFCMEGILPLPISQLEKNVPIQISSVFSAFGISLEQLLASKTKVDHLKPEKSIKVKTEEQENTFIPIWNDHEMEHTFEENIITQSPVKKKKRGRPRKNTINDNKKQQEIKTETPDNEEDWKPKKEQDLFPDWTTKDEPESDHGMDFDNFEDFKECQNDDSLAKKTCTANKVQRNMVENYAEIAKELEHVIKFQIPKDNIVDQGNQLNGIVICVVRIEGIEPIKGQ